jgi:alpha-L-rhamnosidase
MKNPFLLLLLFLPVNMLFAQTISVQNLRCEYNENPIGMDVLAPRLSWQLKAETGVHDIMQSAYQIQVASSADGFDRKKDIVWDSKKVSTDQSLHIIYEGKIPASRDRFYWRVKIWDNQNQESKWSEIAFWEMGLLKEQDWTARWIEPELEEQKKANNSSPLLRKGFKLKSKIKKARLYITSHGLYQAELNGQKITDDLFTPGWTSYNKRLQYQTYDVTGLLQKGENAVGVRLGDGWYRGEFGWENNWNIYGDNLGLLFQLEIEYNNGKKETIISDNSWKATTGSIRMSSVYDGEVYNANLEMGAWTTFGFEDQSWNKVREVKHPKNILIAPAGIPVRAIEVVKPIAKITTPKGETVVDMGQNMVGRIRFKLKGNKGDTITIYHAEVLDKDGNFYTENLRHADQKVQYIFKGEGIESYEPTFTFQGFRYIKIEDFQGSISIEDFEGVVIHSAMESTGHFDCSNSMINQLQSNIRWGQKGNFLDVPTDCPQRDERMGWTGDAQAFAPTACFNYNTAAFYTKWMGDFRADQFENGSIPWVIPDVLNRGGAIGWADAVTIIPWTMYLKYGDEKILEVQYESMSNWVDFLDSLAGENHLVQDGFHFGDWLFFIHPTDWNTKPGYTDIDVLGTAFLAYSAEIVAKSAAILGKKGDAQKYTHLHDAVKSAFQNEFISNSGRLSSHSQTGYTLALAFDLFKPEHKAAAVNYLTQNIIKRGYHLSTGFLGTPHLNHVLSENDQLDVAYKLLLQDKYPSWLYPVTKGATTIWERWDGIKPDGSFQSIQMNSFNHYAYGAIGDWIYSTIGGIKHDPEIPGYKHIIIQPEPHEGLTYANTSYISLYGEISSSWKIEGGDISISITIPPNTSATVILPQKEDKQELGSGVYDFKYPFEYEK